MDVLRVRAYNVHFGDAILITVPDRDANGTVTMRRILIDVGNVLSGSGGVDDVFGPVIEDILQELDGDPLDLYVMTHEHLDHVQGLFWAKQKHGLDIKATHSWLTASSAPDYYDRFSEAKKKKLAFDETYNQIAMHFQFAAERPAPAIEAMLLNNNPRSTANCVEHLRSVGETTTYVSRATDLADTHPFDEAEFEIWGPEEDTSIYYGRFRPMGLAATGANSTDDDAAADDDHGDDQGAAGEESLPVPPAGVDAGAFYDLVERRQLGIFDNLLKIDKASNNTSLVMLLKWRGWRLLFPGDAESRSWKEMNKRDLLGPVHMLKLGHHGSHNGTPTGELLEEILPVVPTDDRPRSALLSTHEGTYNKVPDVHTLEEITTRCDSVSRIGESSDGLFVDLEFADLAPTRTQNPQENVMPDDQLPLEIAPIEAPRQFDAPQLGLALAEVDRLIRANEARNLFGIDGTGLTVAVCDTGLNSAHVDFLGRVAAQQNFTADNGGSATDATDGNGHGTNVGGIIVADGDHRGVAPGASIIPLKVLGDNGSGSFAGVVDALDWVIDNHEEHTISAVCMSLGASDNRQTDEAVAGHAINDRIDQLRALRIPVGIAAGNDYFVHDSEQGMSFPGILRGCVSVGAVYDEFEGSFNYGSGATAHSSGPDRITPFSQRLHEDVGGDCRTDIFAPGAPVTSSGISGPRGESVQHGTSQATPVTIGVLLLMQDLYRRLAGELPEVDDLVEALRNGAVQIHDGDDEDDNVVNTDLDYQRLDAVGALGAVVRQLQREMFDSGEPLGGEPVLPVTHNFH